ncbi:uncharacterized protein [Palaemon carinicauda]|uniref:uncharacterized protein n=1 Tax=Palaemon carinicauda TaxID=392227 RepID=UPI0035B5DA7C
MKAIIPLLLVGLLSFGSANEDGERDQRIFAFYSTTSQTRLTTTTITGLYTCLSTIATPTCLGRKKRMFIRSPKFDDADELGPAESSNLDGSFPSDEDDAALERSERSAEENNRKGMKLTIWSTAFSTITITSTSVLAGTTVSASALCAATGITAGCFVG